MKLYIYLEPQNKKTQRRPLQLCMQLKQLQNCCKLQITVIYQSVDEIIKFDPSHECSYAIKHYFPVVLFFDD